MKKAAAKDAVDGVFEAIGQALAVNGGAKTGHVAEQMLAT